MATLEQDVAALTTAIDNLTAANATAQTRLDTAVTTVEESRVSVEAAVATLVQITNVIVADSATEIPDPPATNTLYLIRA